MNFSLICLVMVESDWPSSEALRVVVSGSYFISSGSSSSWLRSENLFLDRQFKGFMLLNPFLTLETGF